MALSFLAEPSSPSSSVDFRFFFFCSVELSAVSASASLLRRLLFLLFFFGCSTSVWEPLV